MGRKVFAPTCTRMAPGVLHSLRPLSALLVSAAVCLVGLVACLDLVHGSHHHHHHSRGAGAEGSDRLCSFTAKEEQEHAAARYEGDVPSSSDGLHKFLLEWQRDVRPEDTVRYQPVRMIGSGSQGSVVEAKDLTTKRMVAIKQVKQAFASGTHALSGHRVLQELVILRLMNSSDHTISILHAFLPNDANKENFTNVYFVMELMDVMLQSKRSESRILKLPVEGQKKMMFDVLSALDEMHQVGIYHRDIAGWNIMGNFDCSFKVIDLGMASHTAASASVFRRYDKPRGPSAAHRPPEVIYKTDRQWSPRGDIWLTGCTFLRLIAGRHNICDDSPTRGTLSAFASIVNVVGMPSNDTLSKYGTRAREFFENLRPHSSHLSAGGIAAKYSERADKELLGLVQKMVVLDPESRPSAAELLQDPVFADLRGQSQSSKDKQRLVADSVSESLEILKGSTDAKHNRNIMYQEILNNYYHHPGNK